MSIPTEPLRIYYSKPSPDGSHVGLLKSPEAELHFRLLTPEGRFERDVTVKEWPGCRSYFWSADSKGIYCGILTQEGGTLLRVGLNGKARVLWQDNALHLGLGTVGTWAVPSPDGRYLAIMSETTDSNVWTMENF